MVAQSVCFPWKRINGPPSDTQIISFQKTSPLGVSHSCLTHRDLQMVKKINVKSVPLLQSKYHMDVSLRHQAPFLPGLCPLDGTPEWLLQVWGKERSTRTTETHLFYCTSSCALPFLLFYRLKVGGNSVSSKPARAIFLQAQMMLAFLSNKVFFWLRYVHSFF